jgi:hypothetical protein
MTARLGDFIEAHGRALVLIVLSFALAGAVFLFQLPIAIFPQTDFPRIVILVDNGIAPVNVQLLSVTRPLEEAIRLVPGITDVRSVTARGSTEISAFFRWDVDILNALHLVQGRISQIIPSLPPAARFYINRLTFSVFPMVGFSITSPSKSTSELWDLAYYDIAPRLYRLPGVAETRIPRPGGTRKAEQLRLAAHQGGGRHPEQQRHHAGGDDAGELPPVLDHRDRPDAEPGRHRKHGGGRGKGHARADQEPGAGGLGRATGLQHRDCGRAAGGAGQRAPAARRKRRRDRRCGQPGAEEHP